MRRDKTLAMEVEPRRLKSEEALMLAVFEQAVADLSDTCPAVRADAEAYFFAYGADSSAFSFDAVCSQFGFSPAAVREALGKRCRGRATVRIRSAA